MNLCSTGVAGLDRALSGGLPRGRMTLVQGEPGSGKTTLALQFLLAGQDAGERGLLLSLSEREDSLREKAEGHGWSLEGLRIHELAPSGEAERRDARQVVFDSRDVELGELVLRVRAIVDRTEPQRVVIDALSHLRLLAGDPHVYLQRLFELRDFFAERGLTVLATETPGMVRTQDELQAVCDAVLLLSQAPTRYGNERRRLRILKVRNQAYQPGVHDFEIKRGGLHLYPRLRPSEAPRDGERRLVTTAVAELDELLGGGLREGTSCLVVGPSGTGKTSLSTLFVQAAAARGERAAVFLFDELETTFLKRSQSLGMDIQPHIEAGRVTLHEVGTAELSPGALVERIQREVDERGARVMLIDTLTGYLASMPDEQLLVTQLHDLLTYLNRRGVLSIVVVAQHGVLGPSVGGPVDVSYLADAVVLLRHFESKGSMHQAISVYKKRYGHHERRIRELRLVDGGIEMGPPVAQFTQILTGAPRYTREREDLFPRSDDARSD